MNALTPNEVTVIQMALSSIIEDLNLSMKDQRIPFTPESRNDMKDILSNAESALSKIQKASGNAIHLDPYRDGDEKEFLTKES